MQNHTTPSLCGIGQLLSLPSESELAWQHHRTDTVDVSHVGMRTMHVNGVTACTIKHRHKGMLSDTSHEYLIEKQLGTFGMFDHSKISCKTFSGYASSWISLTSDKTMAKKCQERGQQYCVLLVNPIKLWLDYIWISLQNRSAAALEIKYTTLWLVEYAVRWLSEYAALWLVEYAVLWLVEYSAIWLV